MLIMNVPSNKETEKGFLFVASIHNPHHYKHSMVRNGLSQQPSQAGQFSPSDQSPQLLIPLQKYDSGMHLDSSPDSAVAKNHKVKFGL